MAIPESINRIMKEEERKTPKDIDAAVRRAMERIADLPEYPGFISGLIFSALQQVAYSHRHQSNVKTRRSTGSYSNSASTGRIRSRSSSVRAVHDSVYDYRINGTILGDILGEELPTIAENLRKTIRGYEFNAELCEWLAEKVTVGRKVRECVTEASISRKMKELRTQTGHVPE